MQKNPREIIRLDQVGLCFSNRKPVLENISFTLLEGTFHFLTGPSGAGKSSLLRLIHLSLRPTQGRLWLLGFDVTAVKHDDIPHFRRHVSFVFQDFRLLDHLSTLDNVALPLRIQGASAADSRAYARELLKWVGLEGHYLDSPLSLSGGQKQRVAIARAVITRPKLLLADEPTGNVDDETGIRLLYLFEKLNQLGTTVLVATHNHTLIQKMPYPELHLEGQKISLVAK